MKLFDARAALAEIEKQDGSPATSATSATQAPKEPLYVASVADVAAPPPQNPKNRNLAALAAEEAQSRTGVSSVLSVSRFGGGRKMTDAHRRPDLPLSPPTCTLCGQSDWTVALTFPDGQKAHVGCAMPDESLGTTSKQAHSGGPPSPTNRLKTKP